MLLDTCTTVGEAKKTKLLNRIIQVSFPIYILIANSTGDVILFELNKLLQTYIFTDRKVGDPLFAINHAVLSHPTPGTFPAFDKDAEHNTFNCINLLKEAYRKMVAPFDETGARELIGVVNCSFVDCKKAECVENKLILINTSTNLTKLQISSCFYLSDTGPIEGANQMGIEYSNWYTFCL